MSSTANFNNNTRQSFDFKAIFSPFAHALYYTSGDLRKTDDCIFTKTPIIN
jgi:hypothetical protein